jgi:hypothetical protein
MEAASFFTGSTETFAAEAKTVKKIQRTAGNSSRKNIKKSA